MIGKNGRDIAQSDAEAYISGYGMLVSPLHDHSKLIWLIPRTALGIDMTARNMQDVVKKAGLPWSTVKGFDTFTPISKFIPKSSVEDPHNLKLWLKVGWLLPNCSACS